MQKHVWNAGTDTYEKCSPEEWCQGLKALDKEYSTSKASPLHHDQRCDVCR